MSTGVLLLLTVNGYAKLQVNRNMIPDAKLFLQRAGPRVARDGIGKPREPDSVQLLFECKHDSV